jgi:hypothetical protein
MSWSIPGNCVFWPDPTGPNHPERVVPLSTLPSATLRKTKVRSYCGNPKVKDSPTRARRRIGAAFATPAQGVPVLASPSARPENSWHRLRAGGPETSMIACKHGFSTREDGGEAGMSRELREGRSTIRPFVFMRRRFAPGTAKVLQTVPYCAPTTYVTSVGGVEGAINQRDVSQGQNYGQIISQHVTG